MSSIITHTFLPTFSLHEASVLLWRSSSAIVVKAGNTDTERSTFLKCISIQLPFVLMPLVLEAPEKRSVWDAGNSVWPQIVEQSSLFPRDRKKLLPFPTRQEKYLVLWWGCRPKALFQFATVSIKLGWTELNSPGDVGSRPDVAEFTFSLLNRLLLIVFWSEPPKREEGCWIFPCH